MFTPGVTFQPSLIRFVAMNLSQSKAPGRCFTQVGAGLTCKHNSGLEKPAGTSTQANQLHSSKTDVKSFITLGPGIVAKNLLLSKMSTKLANFMMTSF